MQMDWTLLRQQKLTLLEMQDLSGNAAHIEAIEGLLSLLDHIQDSAVDSGEATELEVFGTEELI